MHLYSLMFWGLNFYRSYNPKNPLFSNAKFLRSVSTLLLFDPVFTGCSASGWSASGWRIGAVRFIMGWACSLLCRTLHHKVSPRVIWSKNAVKSSQVKPGRWDHASEPLHEISLTEDQRLGAITPLSLEPKFKLTSVWVIRLHVT